MTQGIWRGHDRERSFYALAIFGMIITTRSPSPPEKYTQSGRRALYIVGEFRVQSLLASTIMVI